MISEITRKEIKAMVAEKEKAIETEHSAEVEEIITELDKLSDHDRSIALSYVQGIISASKIKKVGE